MSDLKIRKIPFKFDDVDFIWNPDNRAFSVYMNKISFLAICFEKYICQVMQDAEAVLTDPAALEEARAFRAQEGLHALVHRNHVKALVKRYPGLQKAVDVGIEMYDKLYAERDLKYHLAYIGGLESTFTPTFRLYFDNLEKLYGKGDTVVASMFLWHFSEEMEHRNSGVMVYEALPGPYLYRASRFPEFLSHSLSVVRAITAVFHEVFPELTKDELTKTTSAPLPLGGTLKALWGLVRAQAPWHDHRREPLPDYYFEWMKRYERGEDMTRTYGVGRIADMAAVA